jgi:hypothetical protein
LGEAFLPPLLFWALLEPEQIKKTALLLAVLFFNGWAFALNQGCLSFFGSRVVEVVILEHITCATGCENQFRIADIFFKFAAQATHMHIDHAGV